MKGCISVSKQNQGSVCAYVGCKTPIPLSHFLCSEHYEDWRDELINQCPKCGRFKDAQYNLCSPCYYRRPTSRWTPPVDSLQQKRRPQIEHSQSWEKLDQQSVRFFVYILNLDGGKFYVGQTRELRERLSEHMDGKVASTKGFSPRLQYFEILPTREAAEIRESELKKFDESNPRQIRRMILGFKDLVSELNYQQAE